MVERIPITEVSPVVERGRYPVKAVVGESLEISATIFREGHDLLGAGVVLKGPRGRSRPLTRLELTGADEPDRYAAWVTPGQARAPGRSGSSRGRTRTPPGGMRRRSRSRPRSTSS